MLSETAIKQEECFLYCRLEIERGRDAMFVEFNDKNSSRLTTFSITKGVKVVKSSEVIEVSELFFFIASRLPSEEIKLHPKRMVHLWDLTEKKWKLIYLQRDEKCVKEYDEDEADEAEDVQ